jgi:hypothetical protein
VEEAAKPNMALAILLEILFLRTTCPPRLQGQDVELELPIVCQISAAQDLGIAAVRMNTVWQVVSLISDIAGAIVRQR